MIGLEALEDLQPQPDRSGRIYGVVVGMVTNNKDPKGLGRVKVKFPWLTESFESNWARVAAPMAGAERGFFFLPEVDDEVLVVFEQGMVHRPYVLGALWNGVDKPPTTNPDGKNNLRVIASRSGSVIEFTDDEDSGVMITVADKARKNTIIINAKEGTVTITSEADTMIKAKGNITLESANGDLTLNCNNFKVAAKQKVEIKATATAAVEGASVEIKGSQGVTINDGALKVI